MKAAQFSLMWQFNYRIVLFIVLTSAAIGAALFLNNENKGIIIMPNPLISGTPTESPASNAVKMVFVGDIMLSRSVGAKMSELNDFRYPFRKIADYLNSFDLAFANLETPISDRGVKVGSIYSFRSDPRSVDGLNFGGIDVVSLANNHIWDYGREAFADTMKHLNNGGIDYIGAGSYEHVHQGVVKEIKNTKIGFLAYTNLAPRGTAATPQSAGVGFIDTDQLAQDIKNLKMRSDIVIISFHFGDEYKQQHNSYQENISELAINSGADLVVGHHPHVVQEVEKYKNGWIAYSLGNFIFDQNFSKETMEGLVLEVDVRGDEIISVRSRKINISKNYQPSFE